MRVAVSQNKKIMLQNFGTALSRNEMKMVVGGFEDETEDGGGSEPGTCCAHNADWSYQSCGISMGTAQARASQYAQGSGQHGYWCCSSC